MRYPKGIRISLALALFLLIPFAASADASPGAGGIPGKIVFWSDRSSSIDLWVVRANGEGLRHLTRRQGSDFEPSWSPRGDRVVFQGYGPPAPKGEIYVVGAKGHGLRRVTRNTADDYAPTWSPDGQRILFVRTARGNSDLYVMRSAGSRPRRLTYTSVCEREPDWSPDGKRIVVTFGCDAVGRIKVLNADGSGARFPTKIEGRGPVWSPDGRKIAFTDDVLGGSINIVNADGSGHTTQLSVPVASTGLSWSPDGRMLAFSKTTRPNPDCGDVAEVQLIYVVALKGGSVRRVTKDACGQGDYSPDWHR